MSQELPPMSRRWLYDAVLVILQSGKYRSAKLKVMSIIIVKKIIPSSKKDKTINGKED